MAYKFATSTCAVRWQGGVMRLQKGAAWYADDPFVKANAALFGDEPTEVHGAEGGKPLEQATARPGEKRTTRRG